MGGHSIHEENPRWSDGDLRIPACDNSRCPLNVLWGRSHRDLPVASRFLHVVVSDDADLDRKKSFPYHRIKSPSSLQARNTMKAVSLPRSTLIGFFESVHNRSIKLPFPLSVSYLP
ncbi:hypothetical protein NEF87_002773 [Candidatus Lokiarchaeum ossiferum]|uniref:Uncharacterized protein n=1 Tax=Candidatus Lokiarchaeum ossiferum TaxID=2951803 RepID=A0ABY6HT09_9ARCH|nr:hypothetical protein NEF87_002773 [Candidatus Lokiarchaeum sp. B-35]